MAVTYVFVFIVILIDCNFNIIGTLHVHVKASNIAQLIFFNY